MIDGEWVRSSLAVLPETSAPPSTVPRLPQRSHLATARRAERDIGFGGRGHKTCALGRCGSAPPDEYQSDDGKGAEGSRTLQSWPGAWAGAGAGTRGSSPSAAQELDELS